MTLLDLGRLRGPWPGRAIDYYTSTGSTMDAAVGRAVGTLVIAEEQTAGQGRLGHSWHSEAGSGIYFSIVLQPAPLLTLSLGIATAEAITSATGVACDLRWPNDVMAGGRKLAGVLTKLVDGAAIAGIGINVNHAAFPAELAEIATSLRLQAGREFDRMDILLALIPAVERWAAAESDTILRRFEKASSWISGRRVIVDQTDGSTIEGTTTGLDPAGFLVVRKDDGTDTLILAGGVRAAGTGCRQ
jgi:BirA family biotin operon repressor/biotin-[acetyl-CoA-carboxylase] ligase